MPTDARARRDGWSNQCLNWVDPARRIMCGRFYWWNEFKRCRMTIGDDGEPTGEPHVCREMPK